MLKDNPIATGGKKKNIMTYDFKGSLLQQEFLLAVCQESYVTTLLAARTGS